MIYRVTVWPYEPVAGQWEDEKQPALFDANVRIEDEDAYLRLDSQLHFMKGEEIIDGYSIERVPDPRVKPSQAILSAILGELDDADQRAHVTALWDAAGALDADVP